MLLTKVQPTISLLSRDVNWSLRPLLVWMRLISIDLLDSPRQKSNLRETVNWIYRSTSLLLTVLVHFGVISFIVLFQSTTTHNTLGQTPTWNLFIDISNMAIHCIAVHALIYSVLIKKWNTLHHSMTQHQLDGDDGNKTRRLSIWAVIYIIISDVGLLILFIMLDVPKVDKIFFLYLSALAVVTKIYASSTLLLFCILCKILAGRISSIRQKLLVQQISNFGIPRDLILRKQRSQYTCVSQSIELLNECFGYIMLFEIPCIFVGVINTSMHLVISANIGDWGSKVFSILFFINHVINLMLICLSSEKINTEKQNLASALFILPDDNNPYIKIEIQSFAAQLYQTEPEISGAGFFKIGKHLIQKLIETTLTYLIIMVQFYADETVTK